MRHALFLHLIHQPDDGKFTLTLKSYVVSPMLIHPYIAATSAAINKAAFSNLKLAALLAYDTVSIVHPMQLESLPRRHQAIQSYSNDHG